MNKSMFLCFSCSAFHTSFLFIAAHLFFHCHFISQQDTKHSPSIFSAICCLTKQLLPFPQLPIALLLRCHLRIRSSICLPDLLTDPDIRSFISSPHFVLASCQISVLVFLHSNCPGRHSPFLFHHLTPCYLLLLCLVADICVTLSLSF